jgi:S1-C subfamily serine protease
LALLACGGSVAVADPRDAVVTRPADTLTFRPTVLLRQGTTQGSGTVIASSDDETLILTAAHVVDKPEAVVIEIHRYNLGLENLRSVEGWPKRFSGRVVARDPAADVAVVRIRGLKALPFVAKLNLELPEPVSGTPVVSVGIDRGVDLSSWSSQVRGLVQLDMDRGGGNRPFLLTATPPEFGRSGGGLFRASDGAVIGVCVGRVEVRQGKRLGVFASSASIRRLLRQSHLEEAVMVARAARLRKGRLTVEPTKSTAPTR